MMTKEQMVNLLQLHGMKPNVTDDDLATLVAFIETLGERRMNECTLEELRAYAGLFCTDVINDRLPSQVHDAWFTLLHRQKGGDRIAVDGNKFDTTINETAARLMRKRFPDHQPEHWSVAEARLDAELAELDAAVMAGKI